MSLIERHFMRPAGVRCAFPGAFDVRPVVSSHRGCVQKRIMRVLRQIAILVVDRVALNQHAAAFGVIADPADDAAPGDVLTVERLEVDRSTIFHVNDLGFFPGRGEEQREDESKAGHGVLHRQGCWESAPSARRQQAPAPVRLHELDPDHVALFPGDLAGPAGRCPVELQLKLRLDELRVFDPEPCAALRDVDDGGLAVRKVCRFRQARADQVCLTYRPFKRDEGKARSEG